MHETQLKLFWGEEGGGKDNVISSPRLVSKVCIKAHCLATLEAITLTILKQTSAVIVLISV